MVNKRNLIPVYALQFIPLILYPLTTLSGGIFVIGFVGLVFLLLGYGLWRGKLWALSMSIFLQGLNIIVRIMMFAPNIRSTAGEWNIPYLVLNLAAIVISGWFLIRLDKPDVHSTLVG